MHDKDNPSISTCYTFRIKLLTQPMDRFISRFFENDVRRRDLQEQNDCYQWWQCRRDVLLRDGRLLR